MVTRSILVGLGLALVGCSPGLIATCADGYMFDMTNQHCIPADGGGPRDVGPVDAPGADAPIDAPLDSPRIDAHVLCNGSCTGATPHCLASTETCVACRDDGDCSAATSHCEPTGHTCVACLGAADCPSPAASVCSASHACAPCTTNADCTHLTGTGVCDAGTCVACTPTDESACGANSCNPTTRACTTTPRMSVTTCHACVADSECASAMERCVPMQFMGASHGSYCLRQFSAGCMRPYTVPTTARASTSGAAAAMYCGVDETVTSCEAVQSLRDDVSCTVPADCGATGIDDGLCQTVNGVANKCTYACDAASRCPSSFTCGGAGYCGSP